MQVSNGIGFSSSSHKLIRGDTNTVVGILKLNRVIGATRDVETSIIASIN